MRATTLAVATASAISVACCDHPYCTRSLYSIQKKKKEKVGERKKITSMSPIYLVYVVDTRLKSEGKKRKKKRKRKSPLLLFDRWSNEIGSKGCNFLEYERTKRRRIHFYIDIVLRGGERLKRNFHWFLRDFYERKPDFPLLFRRNNGRFVTKTKNGDTWACLMTANLNLGKEGEQCARRRGTVSTLVFSNDPLSPRDTIWLRRISRYK